MKQYKTVNNLIGWLTFIIAAKITIIIAYCKNDPKNAISSTCLSAMADTYALQK